MYAQFFGLQHDPFSIAPDPRYLFMSERHREALAHLLYGLDGGGGFVLLSGEIGAGKTTVCRCFLEQVPKNCHVAYIFNPKLSAQELLQTVCDEFHIPVRHEGPGVPSFKDCVDPLNAFLLQAHAAGQHCVLIIDEAQSLSADVLEQLRLLTNLETSERKLLQIILIGQPELRHMLARPELEQLAQRVIARFHLGALTEAETAEYIRHRLGVAGLSGALPFTARALRRIHLLARGVPRRINLLCGRALLGAYAHRKSSVDHRMVEQAAREVFDQTGAPQPASRRRAVAWAAGLALGGVLLGVGAVALNDHHPGWLAAAPTSPVPAAEVPRAAANAGTAPPTRASEPATGDARPVAAVAPNAGASAPTATMPAATTASVPPTHLTDFAALWPTLLRQPDDAWRALAPAWNLALTEGDPCEAAAGQQVQCFSSSKLSLAMIRQLGRPGLLTLRTRDGRTAYAVLMGLTERDALLQDHERRLAVPLSVLARAWQGDFATFWRVPPGGFRPLADGSTGTGVDWLAQRLALAENGPAPNGPQTLDAKLKARIQAFQIAQGLTADGRPGAMTYMQLNRATGVAEPRLQTE